MGTRTRAGLLGLNLALLVVLAIVAWSPRAGASSEAQPSRPRGQYLMVSGRIQGSPTSAIYVLDTINQELLAVRWNGGNKRLVGVGYRQVSADMAAAAGGGR